MSLLGRIFVANAVILALAACALVLSPATVSFPVAAAEAAIVVVGLVAMLALNYVLLRRTLRPLSRLTSLMGDVDLLRPGQRIAVDGADAEVGRLAAAFNGMVARLEGERRDSARRAFAAAEEERRRVARELHDEVGQTLTAVMLVLDAAARHPGDPVSLREAREAVRRTLEEVRAIARGLRPHALDDLGLASALRALALDASRNGAVTLQRVIETPTLPLSEEQELAVYRIAQEAMTNALRHAGARSIVLALAAEGTAIVLRVRDDGRGFAPCSIDDGLGLRIMRERAALAGGMLSVDSAQGERNRRRAPNRGDIVTTPLKARVLLADDHAMVRRGLRLVLDAEPDLEVVAEAGDGVQAGELALREEIDLAVLDVSMPRMGGLRAAAEIAERQPGIRTLMLSMHDDEQYLFEALKAGACGYVLKSAADRDLVEACRAALRGEPFLYPAAVSALIRDYLERARDTGEEPADPLTPRELQVLKLVAEAHTTTRPAGCWASARGRWSVIAQISSPSWGCATASSSRATRSAAASWNRDRRAVAARTRRDNGDPRRSRSRRRGATQSGR